MAVRRLAADQPADFTFTPENLAWAKGKIAEYPDGRQASAVIPVLWKAQEQMNGWLPEPAIRLVADMLDMPYIRVFEIATFYTMFQLQPVGSVAHIGVCGTTPCMLRGAEDLVAICRRRIALQPFQLSDDGRLSWEEVECAGACVNAPMVQIGADTYEDLTEETFNQLLDALERGERPQPGPMSGRRGSEPISGAKTLVTEGKDSAPEAPPANDDSATPNAGLDPTAPETEDQFAAYPDPSGRTTTDAARSVGGEGGTVERTQDEAARAAPGATTPDDPVSRDEESSADPTADDGDEAARANADESGTRASDGPEPPDSIAAERADVVGTRPRAMNRGDAPQVDDLQRISGIGPVLEKTLHDLGIFTFDQLAEWDQSNKEWVNAYLAFKGRIDRENWVEQAQKIIDEGRDAN